MALMEWQDEFSVGVPSIDAQHQKLIGLINDLHEAMLAQKVAAELKPILAGLINYTVTHFGYEEELFEKLGYEEAAVHREIHEALKAKVLEIQHKLEAGESVMGTEVMNFLKEWLTGHILGVDKKYAPFMQTHGVE